MLVLLLGVFMIASGFVLYRKRSMESFFLSGMCISLMLEFCGILIFAAKKGGYSREMLEFLFVSMKLKYFLLYQIPVFPPAIHNRIYNNLFFVLINFIKY